MFQKRLVKNNKRFGASNMRSINTFRLNTTLRENHLFTRLERDNSATHFLLIHFSLLVKIY